MMDNRIETPIVSVVMTTYNRAHLLSETIQSCLGQTLKSWELIIVDGHSTDNTREVVAAFGDSRIKLIESERYLGRSLARNIGLKESQGKYISFLDSDDLIDSRKLATDVSLLEKDRTAGAVYSSASTMDVSTGAILGHYKAVKSGYLYDHVAYYLPLVFATSQLTITRKTYELVGGFDEELDRFEDTDFFRRISRITTWIANPEILVVLKSHSDNVLSNQSMNTIITMIEIFVAKTESEIGKYRIETEASPTHLYLHYAQAFLSQKNGLGSAVRLYQNLFKKNPSAIGVIFISILKMTKFKFVKLINRVVDSKVPN